MIHDLLRWEYHAKWWAFTHLWPLYIIIMLVAVAVLVKGRRR